jgi:predicted metal-binding membrane protein
MWPTVNDRRPFFAVFATLIALMWLSLWVWGGSPYGRFLSHEELGHVHGVGSQYDWVVFLFVAGWTLMIVAMMLPTSLPLLALFDSFVRARPEHVRLVGMVVAGYIFVWTLFGFVIHANDRLVHETVDRTPWLAANAWVIGAGTVLLAGVYQFTPFKYKCLDKCRSPLAFIMERWHGEHGETEAFRLGVQHGIFCLGCCWSLMLLMFAVGVGNLAWMLALAVVMAIEKNVAWGRRLSAPMGGVLVGWGLVLVVTHGSLTGGA